MIVTFISECEKKALKRTRRVLDAFANRIGHNAWQTVITEEGLEAVQTLLKKTATKNTAVSCHRIKSRVRTELQWIVGNKNKFNLEGNVAVNMTSSNQFIGEIKMNKIYANSQGQELVNHLFAVAIASQEYMKIFMPKSIKMHKAAFIAGCWHDIGKLDKQFQQYLYKKIKKITAKIELPLDGEHIEGSKFSFDKYPTHNEISLLFFQLLANNGNYGNVDWQSIEHSIFWHHAKPLRKTEIETVIQIYDYVKKDNDIIGLATQIVTLMKIVDIKLYPDYFGEKSPLMLNKLPENITDYLHGRRLPNYKNYELREDFSDYKDEIKNNAKNNLIRAALVSADRLISSTPTETLNQIIAHKTIEDIVIDSLSHERGLKNNINKCLEKFDKEHPNSERNQKQSEVASNLSDEEIDIAILNGPAGCGKSKIALEWAKNISAKQILWICPRVQICQGLFLDLSNENYLSDAKIEIFTGEIKEVTQAGEKRLTAEKEYFSGDIVILTIDQIINGITTHKNIELLTQFMHNTVIFDEFHEYINMPGFNLFFAELIECKKMQQQDDIRPNTLLVSATPNYFFIDKFLNIKKGLEKISSFNNKPYTIKLKEFDETSTDQKNPFYQSNHENDTIIISNTAIDAQRSFIKNQNQEKSLLIHSKYVSKDRVNLFSRIMKSFKEGGDRTIDVLRSSPIIQASLNISCKKMLTEIHCPENTLQRMGRLNRFAEYEKAEFCIYYAKDMETGKKNGNQSRFLSRQYVLESTKCWFIFLKGKSMKGITINKLYEYYEEFYQCEKHQRYFKKDLLKGLKEGILKIKASIYDPRRIKPKKSNIKIKKHSLRGNSRFVQMAVVEIKDLQGYQITKKYLVDEDNSITLSLDEIKGYGASDRNLLSFMKRNHHNIIEGTKKSYKDVLLENEARNPDFPIYVSYTPQDLDKVKPHRYSIYYFIGNNHQPIGIMQIDKL